METIKRHCPIPSFLIVSFWLLIHGGCTSKKECEISWDEIPNTHYLDQIRACLGKGLNPDTTNAEGQTLLEIAIENGNEELIDLLIESGVDPFTKTSDGIPITQLALKQDFILGADKLWEYQISTWNTTSVKIQTSILEKVIEFDNSELTCILIDKGLRVNEKLPNGLLPVAWAAFSGSGNALSCLLEKGGDPDSEFDTRPALIMAAMNNYPDILKQLIEAGADIDNYEGTHNTALMFASKYNFPDVVKILVENDADLTLKNLRGETATNIARSANNLEVLTILEGSN